MDAIAALIDHQPAHRGPKTRVRGLNQFREERIGARPSLTAELRWGNQRARRRNAVDCIKYLQPDPIVSSGPRQVQAVHARFAAPPRGYSYALNDPTGFVDPNGLWALGVVFSGQVEGGVFAGAGAQIAFGAGLFFSGTYWNVWTLTHAAKSENGG